MLCISEINIYKVIKIPDSLEDEVSISYFAKCVAQVGCSSLIGKLLFESKMFYFNAFHKQHWLQVLGANLCSIRLFCLCIESMYRG